MAKMYLEINNDEERAEREAEAYHGFKSIDDVDEYENYTTNSSGDRVRLGHDETYWIEV